MAIRFTRLTRPAIRALAPGEKITESGITAECLSNGDTRYVVNIMAAGQRVHRVIGLESDGTTRSQCEEFIAKTWTEAKEGRLSLPRGRATPLTFKAAAKIYLERQERAGARSRARDHQSHSGDVSTHDSPALRVEDASRADAGAQARGRGRG